MPVTPAHAAAAPAVQWLLRRTRLKVPLSAVVIGTMAPDFEYLIRLSPGGGSWHSPIGLFEYCLPVGLAGWWLTRVVIAPAIIELLPPGLGQIARRDLAHGPTARLIPAALIGIAAGAFSHDLWDSFTHEARWGVRELPALMSPVGVGPVETVRWFVLLQYLSSAIGLLIVAWLIWRWVRRQPASAHHVAPGDRAWRVREAAVLILVSAAGGALNALRERHGSLAALLGLAAVGAMAALAIALVVYGLMAIERRRQQPG